MVEHLDFQFSNDLKIGHYYLADIDSFVEISENGNHRMLTLYGYRWCDNEYFYSSMTELFISTYKLTNISDIILVKSANKV
jgi:hypothetical protein